MKSFQELMIKHIRKRQLLDSGDLVLVGCSGGIDSMVLLHFLNANKGEFGISVAAVHIDHMLRGEESRQDRLFTEAVTKQWGIDCFSRAIPIPDILKERGGNKQQLCRSERYAYFQEIMKKTGASKLATAHHADDQLETVLMSGLRGSLQDGDFGMRASRPFGTGSLIRPQLAVDKEQIVAYAEAHGVLYREDSSNAESAYARNRLRQRVLPLLKDENRQVSQNFVELAEDMQQDQQFLEDLAGEKLQRIILSSEGQIIFSAKSFRLEARALQKRMVLLLLNYLYNPKQIPVTRQLVEQLQEMMQSSSGTVFLHLPKNYVATRQYDTVFLNHQSLEQLGATAPVAIAAEWSPYYRGRRYRVMPFEGLEKPEEAVAWHFHAPEDSQFFLRSRKPGDRIQLAGMEQPKKLARLMIDEKIPVPMRESWPVITTDKNELLLVPGLRPSAMVSRHKRDGDNWVLIEQFL
ncbi:tRNA(Ile)-lysidine synthetase-like protein [Planomicrobium stackebrandtii]|uniref:tRNA(Ile)-lysidine synthase n=1 Tax=Planomicrobium stackebrandtii TaxID=253160 RepID=A0ABU0H103_9BACL|nr:tRNA lysidine(34) synthetase TilS [Planomicrobium stackebrandtii]MDQ0430884.1 tRNA(Ile)-lysidine synthetase-like protein [Planomicrobium stackebrandtii]